MAVVTLCAFASTGSLRTAEPQPRSLCMSHVQAPAGAVTASLVLERPIRQRDRTTAVVVCLRSTDTATRIGSYSGEFRFDSLSARVTGVDHLAGGAHVENELPKGRLRFAGAAPNGTAATGAVLRVRLALSKLGRLPSVNLVMLEVNSLSATPLIARTRIIGLAGTAQTPHRAGRVDAGDRVPGGRHREDPNSSLRPPALVSMEPVEAARDRNGGSIVVTIRGSAFSGEANTVVFGEVAITNVRSSDGGTVLRFTVPREVPSAGEAPPRTLPPGQYLVTVQTAAGVSNALTFRLVR